MDGRDPSNHVLEVQDFPFVVVVAGDLPTHLQKVPNIHKTSRTGGNGWEETPRNLPPLLFPFVLGRERGDGEGGKSQQDVIEKQKEAGHRRRSAQ